MIYVLELSLEIYIIEVFGILLLLLGYSRAFRRENRGDVIPVVIELCMHIGKKGESNESITRRN